MSHDRGEQPAQLGLAATDLVLTEQAGPPREARRFICYVYQLKASGQCRFFDGQREIRSSTVFTTREKAESRIDKFRAMVTSNSWLGALDDKAAVEIVALEIVE